MVVNAYLLLIQNPVKGVQSLTMRTTYDPLPDSTCDSRPLAGAGVRRPAAGFPFDLRPQTPRSAPDRPPGPARPAARLHRRRPGRHPAHRPALAQRLPGARPGRPAAAVRARRQAEADGRPGPRPAAVGPRRPRQARAGPRQL